MTDLAPDWISVAPNDVPRVTGISRTRVWEAINSGELDTVQSGPKRRVVTRKAIEAWLEQLAQSA